MKLYVRNISNLTDARFFAAYPTHYFGFCFDALNENAVTINQAKAITEWLYQPKIVGQFSNYQTVEEILYVHEQLNFDAIELDTDYPNIKEVGLDVLVNQTSNINTNDTTNIIMSDLSLAKQFPNCYYSNAIWTIEQLQFLIAQQVHGIVINCNKEEKAGISNVDIYADWMDIIEDYLG